MSVNTHINNFTAADIEKYHKGLLSAAEMHQLEKAALDDPFLADALEGYATPGVNVVADMADLKKRLFEKAEQAKVIPLTTNKDSGKPFAWLRIAAAVVVIGGAALLANQFLFKGGRKTEMAVVTDKQEKKTQTDTVTKTAADAVVNDKEKAGEPNAATKANTLTADGNNTQNSNVRIEDGIGNKGEAIVIVPAAPVTKSVKEEVVTTAATAPTKPILPTVSAERNDDLAKQETKKEQVDATAKYKARQAPGAELEKVNTATNEGLANSPQPARKVSTQIRTNNNLSLQTRLFRGRITDASNNGLPFAKVYNPADNNAGTYTDAKGNFTLTYPDSVLNVQVKALGFEIGSATLQTNLANNRVVMQDDRHISPVVISNQRVNTNMRSAGNMNNRQLIEPEPSDGWENYDAYIANNLEIPQDFRDVQRKTGGAVQVSFEVDKNGEPVNITVDKSLCASCDKEAIRLVKEGPKWKRTANKHGRTTVTINF